MAIMVEGGLEMVAGGGERGMGIGGCGSSRERKRGGGMRRRKEIKRD